METLNRNLWLEDFQLIRPDPFSKSQCEGKQDYIVLFFIQSCETGESSGASLDFVNLEGFFLFSPCLRTQNSGAFASSDDVRQSCEQVLVPAQCMTVV